MTRQQAVCQLDIYRYNRNRRENTGSAEENQETYQTCFDILEPLMEAVADRLSENFWYDSKEERL